MMNGKPQALTSKFKLSYNLLLNLLDIGDKNLVQFASKSMITGDIDSQMEVLNTKMTKLQTELDNLNSCVGHLRTPLEIIQDLIELKKNIHSSVNKKRKEIERKIAQITDNYKFIQQNHKN